MGMTEDYGYYSLGDALDEIETAMTPEMDLRVEKGDLLHPGYTVSLFDIRIHDESIIGGLWELALVLKRRRPPRTLADLDIRVADDYLRIVKEE